MPTAWHDTTETEKIAGGETRGERPVRALTFIVRHLNSVFMLRVQNFLRDASNRGAHLTINVYKLRTEGDEIMQ